MQRHRQQSSRRAKPLAGTLPRTERLQALIVVRELRLRNVIARECERCHYQVVATRTSNELLSLMASSLMGIRSSDPFALFIIDSWTTEYHGLRILRGIRSSGWQAPAILLVDRSDASPQHELLELQVNIVLSKPVGTEEIHAAIQSCHSAQEVLDAGYPAGMPVLYM